MVFYLETASDKISLLPQGSTVRRLHIMWCYLLTVKINTPSY